MIWFRLVICLLTATASAVMPAAAVIKLWTGAANGNWNVGVNWQDGIPPTNGDDLVFQAGAVRTVMTNNIANTRLRSLTFVGSNYVLRGQSLIVSNESNGLDIDFQQQGGTNTIVLNILLLGSTYIRVTQPAATFICDGSLSFSNASRQFDLMAAGRMQFRGRLLGNSGVSITGGGIVTMEGSEANSYPGTTALHEGDLELRKTSGILAASGASLYISSASGPATVRLFGASQISSSAAVRLDAGSLLDLNGYINRIGNLHMQSATISTFTGELILGGTLTVVPTNSTISGKLSLAGGTRLISTTNGATLTIPADIRDDGGSAGLTKTNGGLLVLSGSNTFSGAVLVSSGTLRVENNFALGANGPTAYTRVHNNASLSLAGGLNIAGETLRMSGRANNGALFTLSNTTNSWTGPVELEDNALIGIIGTRGRLVIDGPISGPGALERQFAGTLVLAGSQTNTYTGGTSIFDGVVELAKTTATARAIPAGMLVIGQNDADPPDSDVVRCMGNFQIANGVTLRIYNSGLLDVGNFAASFSSINFRGGDIVTTTTGNVGPGTNITVTSSATNLSEIIGRMAISSTCVIDVDSGHTLDITASIFGSGGQLIKRGQGGRLLLSSNTFGGPVSIEEGTVVARHSAAFGGASAGTFLGTYGVLELTNDVQIIGEPLALDTQLYPFIGIRSRGGSNSWTGSITLASNALIYVEPLSTLNLGGRIIGFGSCWKYGEGTLIFSGSADNIYTGDTGVDAGVLSLRKLFANSAIPGNLRIAMGANPAEVCIDGPAPQIADHARVELSSRGRLRVALPPGGSEAIGPLWSAGEIILATNELSVAVDIGETSFSSGTLTGLEGRLTKDGQGPMELTGTNLHTGLTLVRGGTLAINSLHTNCLVQVNPSGALTGAGQLRDLDVFGILGPAPSMACNRLTLHPGSTFRSTVGGGIFPLRATFGSLSGGRLEVSLGGEEPFQHRRYDLIQGSPQGVFQGLPAGAFLSVSGLTFAVHYETSIGQGIYLTPTNAPALADARVQAGNGNRFIDPAECNFLDLVVRNSGNVTLTGVRGVLANSALFGTWVLQAESPYDDIPPGQSRTNHIPFQINIPATSPCGNSVELSFTLLSDQFAFAFPVTFESGRTNAQEFHRTAPESIPVSSTVHSTNIVSGVLQPLHDMEMSLYLSHTSSGTGNMTLTIVSPDNRELQLAFVETLSPSSPLLGFGTNCAEGRTILDDYAPFWIRDFAASPPYIGRYQPDFFFYNFRGMAPDVVNGPWRLRINNRGRAATLHCWSLKVITRICDESGGECDTCLPPIVGSISSNDPPLVSLPDGFSLECGQMPACSSFGPLPNPPPRYDVYTFTNNGPPSCVAAQVTAGCSNALASLACLGTFAPNAVCANVLGIRRIVADGSFPTFPDFQNSAYDFPVPGGAVFSIVIFGQLCSNYTVRVAGIDCPRRLNIEHADPNHVVLDWSSALPLYSLEARDMLSQSWSPLPEIPPIENSHFRLTNQIRSSSSFFRLRRQ